MDVGVGFMEFSFFRINIILEVSHTNRRVQNPKYIAHES